MSERMSGWARHPRSGETYAVEYDEANRIIRAVGPVRGWELLEDPGDYVTNAPSDAWAEDDGAWLEAEGAQAVVEAGEALS